jgi:hypothetical protein
VKDRRTLIMLALLLVLGVAGAAYLFGGDDSQGSGGGGSGGGIAMGSVAVLSLILLALVSAGASRSKRVVRDEEEVDVRDRALDPAPSDDQGGKNG